MTPSAIGCRGWGSRRAGRIRTLPGASRAPRSPTPPSQLAPHTSPPPAPRRKRVRREAKLEDDGYSVTKSNANVRSERVIKIPAACVALCPRGRDGGASGRAVPRRRLVPDTRPTSAARLDRRGWGGDCLTGKVLT
jgi:hypothetical protein